MRFPLTARPALPFLLFLSTTATAFAQTPSPVRIHAASTDELQQVLFVEGENFSSNSAVYLGGVPLGGAVVNATGTALTANITGTLPGSYQLLVSDGTGIPQYARFEVTLGHTGAQGPAGETGPPGPAGPGWSGRPAGTRRASRARPRPISQPRLHH